MTVGLAVRKIGDFFRKNSAVALIYWQLFVTGCLLVYGLWTSAFYVKQFLFSHFNVTFYPWTDIFFNPQMSRFLNYLFAASGLAFFYAVFFSNSAISLLLKNSEKRNKESVILLTSLIILSLALSDYIPLKLRSIVFLALEMLSLLLLFFPAMFSWLKPRLNSRRIFNSILTAFIFLLTTEVIPLVKGPVFLMNEYQNLYSVTAGKKGCIDNKIFLEKDIMAVSREEVENFRDINAIEYIHQNMTRGQIDHISYIINPLNEYFCGKDVRQVEFQYGFGNTLFLGAVMRAFGGLSVDNYYKCYLIYLLYAGLWLSALFYIFRNSAYVCGAFSFYIISFFSTGFIGFILAPGIIPSIHMFDALVIPLLFYYFKRRNNPALTTALILSLLAVFFNRNFGGALFVSVFITLFVSRISSLKTTEKRFLRIALVLSAGLFVWVVLSFGGGSHSSFLDNLLGFFSFKPSQGSLVYTIFYFLVSYAFLFLIRHRRDPQKYLFLFTLIYIHFLFLYFFWSGLNNHLLHVIQFSGFQLFLMLMITEGYWGKGGRLSVFIRSFVYLGAAAAVIFALTFMGSFYKNSSGLSKNDFRRNFTNHKLFRWDFSRARLLSTINPQPVKESVALIRKYSRDSNSGIYIISKYDNLLPFLAERYSKMPAFYLQDYLRDAVSTKRAVSSILRELPEYIYVDSDLEQMPNDLWKKLFDDEHIQRERESRFGRYNELKTVFEAVRQNYVCVESAGLLTVYKLDATAKSVGRKARF